jgi:hypothetical protein
MRPLMVVVAAILLTACGSTARSPNTSQASAESDADLDCHDEVQLGSSIPRPVCRTKAQTQDARSNAQEMLGGPHPKGRRGRR